ncbi:DUF3551 domain-containing protein [Rhodopseudomonas sp. P2A-2r]|uniref:DUF3551 domain-containing protein n=1 Tax=unclassified Rhodopseudomonas TaxID=2638247 RepID=UPI0022345080|nr:DUF3551 domain-containing protein [Rhodopseudomonas sp. P2A-2r]UZE48192.1 DUF3551 domain-containing protein [Rhodopseudomonas sp. P2A-2r]
MRSILAASAFLLVLGATPSMARDYPWCSRTSVTGFNPSCSFTSFNQCMATVSGIGGDCIVNPRLAFGQEQRPRKSRRHGARGDNDWNNNWNNDWNRRW